MMNLIRTLGVLCATCTLAMAQLSLPAGCGVDMGCYSNCNGGSCAFVITWKNNGNDAVDFGLYLDLSSTSDDRWIGLGLSDDQEMGSDSVTHCIMNGNTIVVGKSYNNGMSNSPIANDGLLDTSGTVQNSVLSCTYTQSLTSTNAQVFDLTQTWFLLVARGRASGGVALQHASSDREWSSSRTDLTSTASLSGSAVNAMVKAHGCLMLFAWVFCASIGIVLARYYKPLWPNSKLCGDKIWFVFHRICMLLALCACVAGFIIIFVEVKEWSELSGHSNFQKAHPYLGVVVTALCVINPVMALFRPHPEEPSRPIFNWAHWFVGTAAHVLAALTLIMGVTLNASVVPFYVVWILLAWVVYQMAIETFLEIHDCCVAGKKKQYFQNGREAPPRGTKTKSVFLILHVIIIGSFTIATIVIVAIKTEV